MGLFQKIKQAWASLDTEPDDRNLWEKINDAGEPQWTEEELNEWIDTLDEELRHTVLSCANEYGQMGGDVLGLLCKARIRLMQQEADSQPRRPTIAGLMWAWDEARLMGAQREFFDRENKKANQRK